LSADAADQNKSHDTDTDHRKLYQRKSEDVDCGHREPLTVTYLDAEGVDQSKSGDNNHDCQKHSVAVAFPAHHTTLSGDSLAFGSVLSGKRECFLIV
jgi:hypothetical protein